MTCVGTAAGFVLVGMAFNHAMNQFKNDHSIRPSAILLAEAVSAQKLFIATKILQEFSSDEERKAALAFRNCHHGTPLGTAVEHGNVPMAKLILSYLSDEEAASGNQCSSTDVKYLPEEIWLLRDYSSVNAAVIALHKCSYRNYPCQEMLDLLKQRDVFKILRETEAPLERVL